VSEQGGAGPGLRERKKQRTFDAVSEIAIAMFLDRGFDRVSVNDVAAAAEISKPTLFRYFPSKEDLVLHRIADHSGEPARVVAARAGGESPIDALHRRFRDGLDARDPVTGLNDVPQILAFHDLVFSTPSLATRVHEFQARDEESLARALDPTVADPLTARLAAAQILAVQRVLAQENWRRLTAGESADALHPIAAEAADRAFTQLRDGLAFSPPAT
jgi:AcrR family transcriptional regulator